MSKKWRKIENEAGYPCYLNKVSGQQMYDHPDFMQIYKSLEEYDEIKYSIYRIAFKILRLQEQLRVPPIRICSGVFSRHQLSLSESTLSLDAVELEAVLADIYFAAEKEGLFHGDVDLTVDLVMNLLLNVYDSERKSPIKVLAAKTLLTLLSDDGVDDKWTVLVGWCADHNGCVSSRRLGCLLSYITALPVYLGDQCQHLQDDVEACFAKSQSTGMMGVSARSAAAWGARACVGARWLPVVERLAAVRKTPPDDDDAAQCTLCSLSMNNMLKFKCAKCSNVLICEKCYLYGRDMSSISGHKMNHLVQEIIEEEVKPTRMEFMKGMKRFLFCTRSKSEKTKKKPTKTKIVDKKGVIELGDIKREGGNFKTSTVSKAAGKKTCKASVLLHDVIMQLDIQQEALENLLKQLDTSPPSAELRNKVCAHSSQLSEQIARLKMLQDNISKGQNTLVEPTIVEADEPTRGFDNFSPIAIVDDKDSKITDNIKNQPRVLSLDSGNFSVASKQVDSPDLLALSGDALKPLVHSTTDSISKVSMKDVSFWHNDGAVESSKMDHPETISQSISATERQFQADIKTVESQNDKMRKVNEELDNVLDKLQNILTNNCKADDTLDNKQLRATANEMESLLSILIKGVEMRTTLNSYTDYV